MYVTVTVEVPAELLELAAHELHEHGAGGVELRDHEVLPPPGMKPPPEGRGLAVGYFEGEADGEGIAGSVRDALEPEAAGAEVRVGFAALPDEDWTATWKLHFKPVRVGDALWVGPPWEAPPAGVPAVVIEPGMAFGTGGHATTALCLQGVVEHLTPGDSVLDVGTGSGVLALAAKRLGAGRVVGTDNDPIAVRVAEENAARNGLAVELSTADLGAVNGPFRLVLANILANTLLELRDPLCAEVAPGGHLLLSGVLDAQAAEVESAYVAAGLVSLGVKAQGEWVLITLHRP